VRFSLRQALPAACAAGTIAIAVIEIVANRVIIDVPSGFSRGFSNRGG